MKTLLIFVGVIILVLYIGKKYIDYKYDKKFKKYKREWLNNDPRYQRLKDRTK